MNKEQMEMEIGWCSDIISAASKLDNLRLRFGLFNKVGNYRQSLRERLYEIERSQKEETDR